MKIVIMCGGAGTRLWPLSTPDLPKQFVPLFKGKSLFELTLERNDFLNAEYIIVTNERHQNLIKEQMGSRSFQLILEPMGKNTAPAIAMASLLADPEEDLLVLPSDHLIQNQQNYQEITKQALVFSQDNQLVTFGIKPTRPETGYGYIEFDGNIVKSFKEKPDQQTAIDYIQTEKFLWNSGMFCFKAKTYLDQLQEYAFEVFDSSQKTFNGSSLKENVLSLNSKLMEQIPSDSIDYAVMEKSKMVKVVLADLGWHDLGSFEALFEVMEKDQDQNHTQGQVLSIDSQNNLILAKQKIAVLGLKNMVIVQTDAGIVVSSQGRGQEIKKAAQVFNKNRFSIK